VTHVCTADEPYRAERHGPVAEHPDSEYVGERFLNANRMALRRCRVCGTRFMTEPTDEERRERDAR
jgi:hypothetical protein